MKKTIAPALLTPYSLRALEPKGWYKNQLLIQANGLSGHLDTFWPDIKDSQWIGGDQEGWERMPYWLDGFIPLAVLLKDEDLLARARRYINAILSRQESDGWLCPTKTKEDRAAYDVWAYFLILKVLVVWEDATGDGRIEQVIYRALKSLDKHIDSHILFNWASTRWYECFIAIFWLYERRPEEWLYDLATKIRVQGFDWNSLLQEETWPYKQPQERGRWSQMTHVVNHAMMLKAPALLKRMTQDPAQIEDAHRMLNLLDRYHGMVTGMFTGDECLSGLSPSQGTELCAVAEMMYSLQFLLGQEQKVFWGDRLERIAFNAWPATFDPAMWTHQYDQQVNQMQAIRQQEPPIYRTNRIDANTFGLEPDFGCCTANFSQGWPKLSQSVFYKKQDGISLGAYLPCALNTTINDANVTFEIETDYPFREEIKLHITCDRAAAFQVDLRIPAWAEKAAVAVNGEQVPCGAGSYLTLERIWHKETVVLTLPMEAVLEERPENMAAITRGPLVYSVKIKEKWLQFNQDVPGHELPHGDFEVYPDSPWNYGLCVDESLKDVTFTEAPMTDCPFSPQGAPVVAKVPARLIQWAIESDSASPKPEGTPLEEKITIDMIPYGCTCLRMTELPVVKE